MSWNELSKQAGLGLSAMSKLRLLLRLRRGERVWICVTAEGWRVL